jgi:hypothetical protein
MAKGFEYDLGTAAIPLNKPFIDIFQNIMNAEVEDDANALNNITSTVLILGTMTLTIEDGEILDKLEDLDLRVKQLIQQHADLEIESMQTRDDEKEEMIRVNSRAITAVASRVINRKIQEIVCYSYNNGPMKGCGISNPSALAFNKDKVYAKAYKFVRSELLSYGLHDVVNALDTGSDLEMPSDSVSEKQQRCPTRKHWCPTRK